MFSDPFCFLGKSFYDMNFLSSSNKVPTEKPSPSIPWLAYFLSLVNATIIGLSFLFTKIAVQTCSVFDTLTFRFWIGLGVFLIYVRLAKIPLSFRGKPWLRLLPIIFFYPIGFFSFQAFGLLYISSSEAGIISASSPIMTALLAAVFIKERTNLLQLLSICLSIFGVVYISMNMGAAIDPSNVKGITLMLLACLSTAGYAILNRILVRSFSPWEITFVLMLSGAVFFSGMSICEHLAMQGTFFDFFEPIKNGKFVVSILYLGIFASLMTTILTSLILKRISSAQMVIFYNLSAVVSIISGFLFLNESVHCFHLIGVAFIIAGVIGTNCFKKEN